MEKHLKRYRERVRAAAFQRKGTPVFNGTADHAAIIAEEMFANAEKYVHILTGDFDARVYGRDEVVDEARLFLSQKGRELKILLEKPKSVLDEHPFVEEFKKHPNVILKQVPQEVQASYRFHLMVMDGDCYRFERDKTKTSAVAAFGDKDGAQNMEDIFGQIWKLSQNLSSSEKK